MKSGRNKKIDIQRSQSNVVNKSIQNASRVSTDLVGNSKVKIERRKILDKGYTFRLNKNKSSVTQLPEIPNM